MKIGILTFHCAHNYGAVLQAYALQEYLLSKGYDACVIDYRPSYLTNLYRTFFPERYRQLNPLLRMKVFIGECLRFKKRNKRYKAFEGFITGKLRLLKMDLHSDVHDVDVFVFGSDQIWNPTICHGFDPVYWGDFKAAKNKLRISYAVSMGKTSLTVTEEMEIKRGLELMDHISVREKLLQHNLTRLTSKNVANVVDPTLLVPVTVFDHIAKDPVVNGPYVLLYQVYREDPEIMKLARHVASQVNGVVIEVLSVIKRWKSQPHKLEYASPAEFLGLVKHACCIVTSSFHGAAFSVIFRKPFYTLRLDHPLDSRSASLLASLGLQERMIEKNELATFSPIDYDLVSWKLAEQKKQSESYLLSALCLSTQKL